MATPSPVVTNPNLHIDPPKGYAVNLTDGQTLTIGSFATYWDGTPSTRIRDAFVRLGYEGQAGRGNGATVQYVNPATGKWIPLQYGQTLRVNNGDSQTRVGSEMVITNSNPLSYIMNSVRIVDGTAAVTDQLYMNLSDSGGSAFQSGTFYVNVTSAQTPVPQKPELVTRLPDQPWKEGSVGIYTVPEGTFRDADSGKNLTYSATISGTGQRLPTWIKFDPASRTFTGTPPVDAPDLLIDVKATDPTSLSATTTLRITTPSVAVPVNQPPSLVGTIDDNTTIEGQGFSFATASAFSDPDSTLTYKAQVMGSEKEDLSELPKWIEFNPTSGWFTGTVAEQADDLRIQVTATDGNKSVSTSFMFITPTPKVDSTKPALKAPIEDQTAEEGAEFYLLVPEDTFIDQDPEDTLTYSVSFPTGGGDWLSFDSASRKFAGTPPVGAADVKVVLTATDPSGKSESTSFTISTPAAAQTQIEIPGTPGDDTLPGTTAAEKLLGGAGNDRLLGGGGNDLYDGGSGTDIAELGASGGSVTLNGIESVIGGTGLDVVTLDGVAGVVAVISVTGVETLLGGSGLDIPVLGSRGSTITVGQLEYLIGGAGTDVVTLAAGGNIITMRAVETLTGGSNLDLVFLGDSGNTMLVRSATEYLIGGSGTDVVTLGAGGSTMTVRGIETLTGSTGNDFLKLGDSFNVFRLSGFETLAGGFGTDIPILGDGGSTLMVSGLEYLIGGAGTDIVTLAGGNGGVITVRGLETMTGSVGVDFVVLGDGGNTMLAQSAIEYLIGGAAVDVVALGSGGNSMTVRGVETLIGGTGVDIVQLGDSLNTLSLSGVETLAGGANIDTVTVSGTVALRFEGGLGGDALTLSAAATGNRVAYRTMEDGAGAGENAGFDSITGFRASDKVELTGDIAKTIDRNGDGTLQTASRAINQVNLAADEAVSLTAQLVALNDGGHQALRNALGKIHESQVGASFTVTAHDASSSALYLVTDAEGDGWLAATEIRLLGVFNGTTGIGISQFSIG